MAADFGGHSPVIMSFGQMAFGSLFLLPVMLLAGPVLRVPTPSPVTIAAVLALGTLSTALAYVMFFRILTRAGATNTMLVTLLVPVSAILLGVLILGETIQPRQFAGLSLIALGLLINDGRPLQYLRTRLLRIWHGPEASLAGRGR